MTGAFILALAGIICRILGVVIRIPLTNIVGNYGMGLYQMVFPLYSLLLVVSSAGFPVAISKMCAKEKDEGAQKGILINAAVLLGAIGLVVTALFVGFAHMIARAQGNAAVGIIYLGIAPSVFLVCIISAIRGYFQGRQNMLPTAGSQIIEQLVKAAFALGLAALFIRQSVVLAVFGAILAVTISEVVALLFLLALFLFRRKRKKAGGGGPGKEEKVGVQGKVRGKLSIKLMWKILKQSAPITVMSAIFPLILVLDSMFIINVLTRAGAAHEEATKLFGISSGAVHTLINLPAVLAAGIATAIVPAVSALLRDQKIEVLRRRMALALNVTVLISIFFSIFFFAFNSRIIDLLYHGAFIGEGGHLSLAGRLLKIESALILLMSLSVVFTAMLQGSGHSFLPLFSLLLGGAAKMAVQFSLIGKIGIYAVSLGNCACFLVAAVLNAIFALRVIKIKSPILKNFGKLILLTFIFFAATMFTAARLPGGRFYVLLGGVIAAAVYGVLASLFYFSTARLNPGADGNKKDIPRKEKLK